MHLIKYEFFPRFEKEILINAQLLLSLFLFYLN